MRRARIAGDCFFGLSVREGIAHAKVAKVATRLGVESQRNFRCENVGECEYQNVVLKLEV